MSFDWHIRFLEEKSFPTICDTPRFEVKQLLPTKITNKNHRSAMMPSEMVGWQCLYCTFINEDASGACIMCQKRILSGALLSLKRRWLQQRQSQRLLLANFVRPSCVVWKEGSNPVKVERRIRYIIWHQREGAPKK